MPPKAKISKEDMINAGLELIRRRGSENLSVRAVAAALNCSTQPIMYHYKTVDEFIADIYTAADNIHTEYIMNVEGGKSPALTVGLNYIRFAAEESELFRFLFQSDKYRNSSLDELVSGDGVHPIVYAIARRTELPTEQAKRLFETLFFCAHGLSVLMADGAIGYDEKYCEEMLMTTFTASVAYMKSKNGGASANGI